MDRNSALVAITVLLLSSAVAAQSLYKYKDENGVWVYTDRRPESAETAGQTVEVSELSLGVKAPKVTVTSNLNGQTLQIDAHNAFAVPVEVILFVDELINLRYPDADQQPLRWTVDANSRATLLSFDTLDGSDAPEARIRFTWVPGKPQSVHQPDTPYRAPFAVATDYPITQSYPDRITHLTPDSRYAVDLAMPIGTGIYAARGGMVFEVASTNFRGGTDPERDASAANIVRIMHDDGSHAIYAHLNWNSIRVRPGERVARGEYIADSGNTGFSTGPHLHFVVLVNRGAQLVSVPVTFAGSNATPIAPQTGIDLVAY